MATVTRTLHLGGVGKPDLLRRLQVQGVKLNAAAEELFADSRFTVAEARSLVLAVELSVSDLGFAEGATMPRICEAARHVSLLLCPLELGQHLRLLWPDQPEGHIGQPVTKHRAPPKSVTVVSGPLSQDDDTPKGFYLRKIEGLLWLRGYRSDASHIWSAEDCLVFCRAQGED
ncbi:helicase [Ideonella sp. A 288]|uniref:helicase n=1 Tax=Ideonella sp. A 288 TaxID=1962181 RepID=UPI000B4B552B|nr:helicase [Ideonella sp. A 288]